MKGESVVAAQIRAALGRQVVAIADDCCRRYAGKPFDRQTKFVIETEISGAILNLFRNLRIDSTPLPRVEVSQPRPGAWQARIGDGAEWETFVS